MLEIQLKFSDAEIEKDFYKVLTAHNQQAYSEFLGGTVEDIQSATIEDAREFVLAITANQILENFKGLKVNQAVQQMQREAYQRLQDEMPVMVIRKNKVSVVASPKKK